MLGLQLTTLSRFLIPIATLCLARYRGSWDSPGSDTLGFIRSLNWPAPPSPQ